MDQEEDQDVLCRKHVAFNFPVSCCISQLTCAPFKYGTYSFQFASGHYSQVTHCTVSCRVQGCITNRLRVVNLGAYWRLVHLFSPICVVLPFKIAKQYLINKWNCCVLLEKSNWCFRARFYNLQGISNDEQLRKRQLNPFVVRKCRAHESQMTFVSFLSKRW